jgi:TetR/AcrR family transcriptional regulator
LQLALWFSPVESEGFQAVSQLNWEQHQIIEGVFISAVEQHGNMHGRHRSYVVTFLGMINTYIGMALNGLVELDNRLVERAVHQFQHGIYS